MSNTIKCYDIDDDTKAALLELETKLGNASHGEALTELVAAYEDNPSWVLEDRPHGGY